MGGLGSGRYRYTCRMTTEDYFSIDIRVWHREGMLIPEKRYGWQWLRNGVVVARLHVLATERELVLQAMDSHQALGDIYSVPVDWTACALGGRRPWFLCPSHHCRKRVALLYWVKGFRCRHCLNLSYPSEREGSVDRLTRKVNVVRKKLGWPPGIFNKDGKKPKGMQWRTYFALVQINNRLTQDVLHSVAKQTNQIRSRCVKKTTFE